MYEPTLNPTWHFNSITLQVEHCQINEGESPIEATWTAMCTSGCCPSSCMSWLCNLASITQLFRFHYQGRGCTWHLHSGRTLSCSSSPTPTRPWGSCGGADSMQTDCKTPESCQNRPLAHDEKAWNTDAAATAAESVWQILIRRGSVSHAEAWRRTQRV